MGSEMCIRDRGKTKKNRELIKVRESNANVPDTRAQQTHQENKNYENIKHVKQQEFGHVHLYKGFKNRYLLKGT